MSILRSPLPTASGALSLRSWGTSSGISKLSSGPRLSQPCGAAFRALGTRGAHRDPYLTAVLYHPLDDVAVAAVRRPVQGRAAAQVPGLPGGAVSPEAFHDVQVPRIAREH